MAWIALTGVRRGEALSIHTRKRGRASLLRRSALQRGTSLVELLLVTGLVMLLAGAMVFNFTNMMPAAQLAEGAGRMEGLIRYARAQAAQTGRKVQVVFAEATVATNKTPNHIKVTWEPDPLGQPGQFQELYEASEQARSINDLVRVKDVSVYNNGTDAPAPAAASTNEEEWWPEDELFDEGEDFFSPITFYPDGTSDSADIVLASLGPDEQQEMLVRVVGLTGSVSHQTVGVTDEAGQDASTSVTSPEESAIKGAPETLPSQKTQF